MRRYALLGTILLSLSGTACVTQSPTTELVPSNPFGSPPPINNVVRTSFAQASLESAARVDTVGQQILAANPQIGVRPLFRTIGADQPEIFHRGTIEVDVTQGL